MIQKDEQSDEKNYNDVPNLRETRIRKIKTGQQLEETGQQLEELGISVRNLTIA